MHCGPTIDSKHNIDTVVHVSVIRPYQIDFMFLGSGGSNISHFEKFTYLVTRFTMRIADFCVVTKRCQQVVKDRGKIFLDL